MILLRSLLFLVASITALLVISIPGLPLLLVARDRAGDLTRWFAGFQLRLLRATTGLDHELRGLDTLPDKPVILAVKHQSSLETYALCSCLPMARFVLKCELVLIPIVGWYIAAMGPITVDRSAGASALKDMLKRAQAAVAQGHSVVIFPEGTRTSPGEQRRYHPGVAALYSDLGLPVVPVAVNTGVFWQRRGLRKRPGTAVIALLEPIPPGMNRKAFMDALSQRIETASTALLEEAGKA
ncbi:MAG: 1-acyl-sn-glycerol-3-phosphate acyltransferase [Rhodospirillales bacterium]|nr:1-acyl-sn-glycerol-3-phosphate acyltransferase [Rhodospirillales bacterium]